MKGTMQGLLYVYLVLLLYDHCIADASHPHRKRHRRDTRPNVHNTLPDLLSITAFQNGVRIACPNSKFPGVIAGQIPTPQPGQVPGQTPTAQPGLVSGPIPTAMPAYVSGQTPTAQPALASGQTPTAQPGLVRLPSSTVSNMAHHMVPSTQASFVGAGGVDSYGTARMVHPSTHQLRQMFESKGGHYIPEYMASTQQEATANFQNILTLSTPRQAGATNMTNTSISAYENYLAKKTLIQDLEKLHFYMLHPVGSNAGTTGNHTTSGIMTPPLPTANTTPPIPTIVKTTGFPTPPLPTHVVGHSSVVSNKTTATKIYTSMNLPNKTMNRNGTHVINNNVMPNGTQSTMSNGTKLDVDTQKTLNETTNATNARSTVSPQPTVKSNSTTVPSSKHGSTTRAPTPGQHGTDKVSGTMPTTARSTSTIDPAVLNGLEALEKYVHGINNNVMPNGTQSTMSNGTKLDVDTQKTLNETTNATNARSTVSPQPTVKSNSTTVPSSKHGSTTRAPTPGQHGTDKVSGTMPTTARSTSTIDPAVLNSLEALEKYVHGYGATGLHFAKPNSTGNESGVSTGPGAPLNRTSAVTRMKRYAGTADRLPLDLNHVWRAAGTVVHPEALIGLTRGSRRQRRNADGSYTEENYCQMKGSKTADGQFLHMCSTCAVTTQLSDDYFPRYINEALCKSTDGTCMVVGPTAHGACKQRTFTLNILRKQHNSCLMVNHNNGTYVIEDWQLHPKQIRVSCECTINKNSVFRQYVSANIP